MSLRPRVARAGLDDAIRAVFQGAGPGPAMPVRQTASQMSSILGLVASGLGLSVVSRLEQLALKPVR